VEQVTFLGSKETETAIRQGKRISEAATRLGKLKISDTATGQAKRKSSNTAIVQAKPKSSNTAIVLAKPRSSNTATKQAKPKSSNAATKQGKPKISGGLHNNRYLLLHFSFLFFKSELFVYIRSKIDIVLMVMTYFVGRPLQSQ
jgi:hypothetical protein